MYKYLVLCVFLASWRDAQGDAELTEIVQRCCSHSNNLTEVECSSSQAVPSDVPSSYSSLCLIVAAQCCRDYHQKRKGCDAGVEIASSTHQCGTAKDASLLCCNECTRGTSIGRARGSSACVARAHAETTEDQLSDDAYIKCCKKAAKEESSSPAHPITGTRKEKREHTATIASLCEDYAPNELCAHHCIPVPGSYKCECNPGYMLMADGRNCKEVVKNRCKPRNHCQHKCNDNGVEVKCSCRRGYELMPDGKSCQDINECQLDIPVCLAGTQCYNIQGSYRCLAEKKNNPEMGQCPPGFTKNLNNQACDDINECKLPHPPCPAYLCENTVGGYKCGGVSGDPVNLGSTPIPAVEDRCPPGFALGSRGECEDVDECETQKDDCNPLSQFCINTHSSFFCQDKVSRLCRPGFKIDPATGKCEDIDECEEDDPCRPEQICINQLGQYNCKPRPEENHPPYYGPGGQECPDGMRMDRALKRCEDINECVEGTHLCDQHQTCLNTNGSFECHCRLGYELDITTGACVDVNECATGQHDCIIGSQRCDNTVGSFLCIRITSCGTGYILQHSTGKCEDVDECALGIHNCFRAGPEFQCMNIEGSFRCVRKRVSTTTTTTAMPEYGEEYEYYDSEEDINGTQPVSNPAPPPQPVDIPYNPPSNSLPPTTSSTTQPPTRPTTQPPRPTTQPPRPTPPPPPSTTTEPPRTTPEEPSIEDNSLYSEPRGDSRPEFSPVHPPRWNPPSYPVEPVPTETSKPERPYQPENPTDPEITYSESRPETPRQPDIVNKEPERPDYRNYYETRSEVPQRSNEVPTERQTERPEPEPTIVLETEPSIVRLEPKEVPTYSPFRPTDERPRPTPPYEVDVRIGEESATVAGEKREDGSVVLDTKHIPKNEWVGVRNKPDCPAGFEANDIGGCFDIDECITNQHSCSGLTETCRNTHGGYLCDCAPGFRRDSITGACDVMTVLSTTQLPPVFRPELLSPISSTSISTTSTTTSTTTEPPPPPTTTPVPSTTPRLPNFWGYKDGRYAATRPFYPRFSCDTGFHMNSQTRKCEDINECTNGQANCAALEICVNTEGGYKCVCPPNWRLDDVRHRCMPVVSEGMFPPGYGNEPEYSPPEQEADSKESNYVYPEVTQVEDRGTVLKCRWGYRLGDDNTCVDIDECSTGGSPCGPQDVCTNLPGGYVCSCPRGHRRVGDNRCEDVDECEIAGNTSICSQNADCLNTVGSYQCKCHNGFRSAPVNDKVCVDVDECSESRPGTLCQHRCSNVWGSYRCHCHRGYRLNTDNRTCSDVDECVQFKSKIPCIGKCLNMPGSYRCDCPPGYRLSEDNRSCIDIDECETGEATCETGIFGGTSHVCFNTRGSYRCQRITCPPGYQLESKHRCSKTERVCKPGDWACAHQPTTISYNFITFVSKLFVPESNVKLFTMRGPVWPYAKMNFELRLVDVNAPPSVKDRADISAFLLIQNDNEGVMSLVRPLEGPQSIELELSMELHSRDQFGGIAIAKLFIFVSEYEF